MSGGIRIFIPTPPAASRPTNDDLDRLGLPGLYLPGCIPQKIANGPDDSGPGYIKEGIGKLHGAGYHPDRQTWVKCGGGADGKYYIGWENDLGAPGPDELLKPQAQRIPANCHEVTLADGNVWQVPVALFVAKFVTLERSIAMIDGQLVEGAVLARYQPLAELADRIAAVYFRQARSEDSADDADAEIEMSEGVAMAIKILGYNYFINLDLAVACLNLFTTKNWMEVLMAVIDLPTLNELVKEAVAEEARSKKKAGQAEPDHGAADTSGGSGISNNGSQAAAATSPPTAMSASRN